MYTILELDQKSARAKLAEVLTGQVGISGRVVCRTVALRLILVNSTSGVDATLDILADVAQAAFVTVALAARLADALEAVFGLATLGISPARSFEALVNALLAGHLGIAKVAQRTGTLSFSVHHATLRVEAAHAMLQTRIRAHARVAAALVGLAVFVVLALELVALFARFALVTVGTEANCAVVGNSAQSTQPAGRLSGSARVGALTTAAR